MTWKKACDCEGATATAGRVVLSYGETFAFGGFGIVATQYVGPVCDKCDTPWVLAECQS